jgi:hypothetical protein
MVQRLDGRGIGHITVHLYSYYLHNKYCRAARQQKARTVASSGLKV